MISYLYSNKREVLQMTTKQKEIDNLMQKLELSYEEALQLWEDDHSNEILPEVAEIEAKSEKIQHKAYSKTDRKKTERKPKEDSEKIQIIDIIFKTFIYIVITA